MNDLPGLLLHFQPLHNTIAFPVYVVALLPHVPCPVIINWPNDENNNIARWLLSSLSSSMLHSLFTLFFISCPDDDNCLWRHCPISRGWWSSDKKTNNNSDSSGTVAAAVESSSISLSVPRIFLLCCCCFWWRRSKQEELFWYGWAEVVVVVRGGEKKRQWQDPSARCHCRYGMSSWAAARNCVSL